MLLYLMHFNNSKEKSISYKSRFLEFLKIKFRFLRNRNGERGEMEFCDRKCLNLSTMRMTYEARVNCLNQFSILNLFYYFNI